jgi:hypothetical protein
MKNVCAKYLLPIAFIAVIFSGCKKNSDSIPVVQYSVPHVGTTAAITLPTNLTSLATVGTTVSNYATAANAFTLYGSLLSSIPTDATDLTTEEMSALGKSYKWKAQTGDSIWVDYTNDGVTKTWILSCENTTLTTKTVVLTVTELVVEVSGTVVYNLAATGGTGNLVYTWNRNSLGYYGTLVSGTSYYMTITNSNDKSGAFKVQNGATSSGSTLATTTWTTTGTGTYTVGSSSGSF